MWTKRGRSIRKHWSRRHNLAAATSAVRVHDATDERATIFPKALCRLLPWCFRGHVSAAEWLKRAAIGLFLRDAAKRLAMDRATVDTVRSAAKSKS
jgi:hypothetical protein